MSRRLELPDEVYEDLRTAAERQGLPIPQLLAQWVQRLAEESGSAASDKEGVPPPPASGPPEEAEAALLQQIEGSMVGIAWEPYRALIEKRRAGTLTAAEQQTLISISDQIEAANARRIEWLAQLARLRGTSLRQVMQDLGIQPRPYA